MFEGLILSLSLPHLCPKETAALQDAADRIEYAYVLEDRANAIAADLRRMATQKGNSSACETPETFAKAITTYLRTSSGDGHFYIEPKSNEASDDDWLANWRANAPSRAYGIREVSVLDGNIGYLRISSFYEVESSFPKYDAAFELLSDTDALILDLRGNGGGSPQTERPLTWTFLDPMTEPMLAMESRIEILPAPSDVPVLWRRYGTERPLAVLIDDQTFSAPEAVAYTLQSVERAVIVGEPSGGGAHLLDEGTTVGEGFTLYVPTQRPVGTRTGNNWEGKGVQPDIKVQSEKAVETAMRHLTMKLSR